MFVGMLASVCATHADVQPAGATPAKLVEGVQSIEALLRVPEGVPIGQYTVFCEALVRKSGRTKEFICYEIAESAPSSLIEAVTTVGRLARFTPATRNGAPADVYMVLMVRVYVTKDGPLILAVPNNGVDAARYGLFYTAPQRFNEFYWNSYGSGVTKARRDILIWQHLQIDEHGRVVSFSLTNASAAPSHIVQRIERQIGRMEFMPGLVDGKPTPMAYLEPAFGRGD